MTQERGHWAHHVHAVLNRAIPSVPSPLLLYALTHSIPPVSISVTLVDNLLQPANWSTHLLDVRGSQTNRQKPSHKENVQTPDRHHKKVRIEHGPLEIWGNSTNCCTIMSLVHWRWWKSTTFVNCISFHNIAHTDLQWKCWYLVWDYDIIKDDFIKLNTIAILIVNIFS